MARSRTSEIALTPALSRWERGQRSSWLPLLTVLALWLAFAPLKQFYFGWIALVPWLIFLRRIKRARNAFFLSILIGFLVNAANMWWLWPVTGGGMVALMLYIALYWGVAALIFRAVGWRDGGAMNGWQIGVAAAVWTGLEFARARLMTGIPWLFIGHTQSPIPVMCQIADVLGVYGISAWVVAVNVIVAMIIIERRVRLVSSIVLSTILIGVLIYGILRMQQTKPSPGPTVMVVQSNFPQSNTGEKGATREELVDFHARVTEEALIRERRAGRRVDLIAWSETMMPPFNPEALEAGRGFEAGAFWQHTFDRIAAMAREYQTEFIVGGYYNADFTAKDDYIIPRDQRNCAYFINREGKLDQFRYDKIHLVPFGEFVPFKESIPWVYKLLTSFAPRGYDYTLRFGDEDQLTPFRLSGDPPARFVSPICFEDVDARLLAKMFRGDGAKRVDFIVNLTNDGWFAQPELYQHLQIAQFRSIENRAPTARSVNTGISGFIDSCGRIVQSLPPQVEGVSIRKLDLDSRLTFYTRHGDVFAWICVVVTVGSVGWRTMRARARTPTEIPTPRE